MVWEGKDLRGWQDISCDIIPFGYSMSREICVPFWELQEIVPSVCGLSDGWATLGRQSLKSPAKRSYRL